MELNETVPKDELLSFPSLLPYSYSRLAFKCTKWCIAVKKEIKNKQNKTCIGIIWLQSLRPSELKATDHCDDQFESVMWGPGFGSQDDFQFMYLEFFLVEIESEPNLCSGKYYIFKSFTWPHQANSLLQTMSAFCVLSLSVLKQLKKKKNQLKYCLFFFSFSLRTTWN